MGPGSESDGFGTLYSLLGAGAVADSLSYIEELVIWDADVIMVLMFRECKALQ